MLTFSKQEVILEYKGKKNLTGSIKITNQSQSPAYFKFKVNRPKFYLVKPNRGLLLKGETNEIEFILHYDGLPEVFNDKFKCFYAFTSQGFNPENNSGFEEKPGTIMKKFIIKIGNLPSDVQLTPANAENKGSELKTTLASGTKFQNSSTLDSLIKQKQDRRALLKKQIEGIQTEKGKVLTSTSSKKGSSIIGAVIIGIIGLAIGFASSLLI